MQILSSVRGRTFLCLFAFCRSAFCPICFRSLSVSRERQKQFAVFAIKGENAEQPFFKFPVFFRIG